MLGFLLNFNNNYINNENTINESFAFFIRDNTLNQLRFLKFDCCYVSVIDYFNLFTNNNKLTSKTKEISVNFTTELVSLKDDLILIKTEKKDFYYQLNAPTFITNLLNELFNKLFNKI